MSFDATALASAEALRLVSFTSSDAFEIGIKLRQLISSKYAGKPAIIDIRAAADDQQYFFAACAEGSQPDNRHWAERKRRSVVRFGKSTASLRMKWPEGIPAHFAASEDDYAIHGGGFPVRVQGVEPLVGTIVVSGLKQEEDHQVIVDVLTEYIEQQQKAAAK
ncbi:hypothetical protein JCM10908_005738 [Rhodotorula pacifica]|uniref:uncharacterized protein n=1 Tax=Rhodotorula pacifica TaxID=1495444 RepID=UPI00316CB989